MSASNEADKDLRDVQAGQVRLHLVDRGQGLPVVFVHGFPLDHSMWEEQIDGLSHDWRVIAPDLRGFGRSQVVAGTSSMEQMADDLAALLGALAIDEKIVLCGLSMGGYIALEFWRKHGQRLRGLVLCDTRAAPDTPEAARGRLETAEKVLREGTGSLAESMLPKLFAPATRERHTDIVSATRQVILNAPPEGIAAALRGMAARRDFRDPLPDIAVPTLVVVGQEDAISPVDEMRTMAQAIPQSEFVIIPHAGHMSPLEDPAGFHDAIEPFLTRVARAE